MWIICVIANEAGIFLYKFLLKVDVFAHCKVLIFSKLAVRTPITLQVWMNADLEMEKLLVLKIKIKIINIILPDLGSGALEIVIVAAGQAILSWHGAGAPAVAWVINPVDCVVWKINTILAYF